MQPQAQDTEDARGTSTWRSLDQIRPLTPGGTSPAAQVSELWPPGCFQPPVCGHLFWPEVTSPAG